MSPDRFSVAIPLDHPAFEGHFPGQPILPGVVLLAEVLAGLEARLGRPLDDVRIKVAKFHAPVGPGARLDIDLDIKRVDGGGIGFTVSCEGVRVATGALAIDEPPPGDGGSAR